MPVGTIAQAKEQALTYQPLLLAEFTFLDGTKLRVASHPLNTAEGGFQYGGHDWLARVLSYDITATQALSESGIDYTPQVSVTLADTNRDIWANLEQGKGFKGATLKLTFVFWNVGANEFSSDSLVKFIGVCGSPDVDNSTLTVRATSLMNMSQVMLPQIRIQKRCPWIFPLTQLQRQEAADDESSQFHLCGYSADASGPNACGNMNGGSAYTSCNYTYSDCLQRLGKGLDITKDGSDRPTGRFGGIQWSIPDTSWSRGYISGKYEEVTTTDNEAKYGDLVPLHYGEGWTDPLVLTTDGSDNNLTKMHVLLGWGKFTDISYVIVNGHTIPHTFNDSEMSYVAPGIRNATEGMKSGWWLCINNGDRNGSIAAGIKLEEQPDPYGNLCVIEVVVPKKLADSSSVPRVQVLAKGPAVRVYHDSDPGGGTLDSVSGKYWRKEYTENLAWILLDVLTWSNWRYRDINIQAFMDYAAICDEQVSYRNQFGQMTNLNADGTPHKRYTASLILRQRRSAAEIVRGLRTAGKCLLFLDTTGQLSVKHKGTLASQQPGAIAGSNYASGVTSMSLTGAGGTGYVAYDFHEGNIAKKSNGQPSLTVQQRGLNEAPNRVTFNFQDRDNRYTPDSLTIIDAEDVARVGQELPGQMPIEGINNMDQGRRCAGTWLAENYRGNNRLSAYGTEIGDTGGTTTFEWETTFKVIHLNVADICRLSYQHLGISNQLVRVIKIKPSSNFGRVTITALHHNDRWYTDAFSQEDNPKWKPSFRNRELRPAFGWNPYAAQPSDNNPLYDPTAWTFDISQEYDVDAAGNAIARLVVSGHLPINIFSEDVTPPFIGLQSTTASTGGTLPGGRTYWLMVCAKDEAGKLSAPSKITSVAVPAGTDTNTVTLRIPMWDSDTAGWALFGGVTPSKFSFQSEGTGTPATITLTAWLGAAWGVPDSEFNSLSMDLYRVVHSGCWGAEVADTTGTTIKLGVLDGAGFAPNQWAGYDVTLLGQRGLDGVALPVFDARVLSNTADTLTLTPGSGDPSAVIQPRDVLICRFKPTPVVGDNWIEDPGLVNNMNGLLDPAAITDCENTTPIVVHVHGTHKFNTGNIVYLLGIDGNTNANGKHTILKLDDTKFQLVGTSGNGAYTGGGTAYRMQQGLVPGSEKGLHLFFISGTGQGMWVKVADNTDTRYIIEGRWPVTPDETSRFIVVDGTRINRYLQEGVNNDSKDAKGVWNVDVTNNRGQVLLVRCNTLDGAGDESFHPLYREIYLFGLPPGERRITTDYTVQKTDRTLLVNAADGDVAITLLPIAEVQGWSLTLIREDDSENTVTVIPVAGDTINGETSYSLAGQFATLNITGMS